MCKPALCIYLTLHKFQFTSRKQQCVVNNINYIITNTAKPFIYSECRETLTLLSEGPTTPP